MSLEAEDSYTPYALLLSLGIPPGGARVLVALIGAALILAAFAAARRSDGDRTALIFSLAAALALTPIAWLHYYVLLLIPLALMRPRLSPLWLLPLLLWVAPHTTSGGRPQNIALMLVVAVGVLAGLFKRTSAHPLQLSSPG